MVRLLRCSDYPMQDAACLERAHLVDDKLFLYQQKDHDAGVLSAAAARGGAPSSRTTMACFFLYDGTSQPQSMVKSCDRMFQKVFATAKPAIKGGPPTSVLQTPLRSPYCSRLYRLNRLEAAWPDIMQRILEREHKRLRVEKSSNPFSAAQAFVSAPREVL